MTIPEAPHVHVFVALGDGTFEGVGALAQGDAVRLTGSPVASPATLGFTAGEKGAELLVWATE